MNYYQQINNRALEIALDPKFTPLAAEAAKKAGITARDWNKNRAMYVYNFAIEVAIKEQE